MRRRLVNRTDTVTGVPGRVAVAVTVVLALLAGACSAQPTTTVEPGIAPDTASDGVAGESQSPTSVPTASPPPSPTAIPTSEPTPAPTPMPRFDGPVGERPTLPARWSEPLPRDADNISGSLANGLQYVVRANDSPGGQAQLRLVVDAGSIDEPDGFEGGAHFLEHMMFNGTERFPGNEVIRVLESFGSGFGPDINAFTSYDATVYQLTVPLGQGVADPVANLALGFEVLAEWADRATIDPTEVVAERGVVREERRRGEERAEGRVGERFRQAFLEGSRYVDRPPIGRSDVIDAMEADALRSFYDTHYRPDLMTIVAVGDFDPAQAQSLIEQSFGSLASAGDPPARPTIEATAFEETNAVVIGDPEITRATVQLGWRLPNQSTESPAALHASLVQALGLSLLDERLFAHVESGSSPFTRAGPGSTALSPDHVAVLMVGELPSDAAPGDLERGVEELLAEAERLAQHPVADAELRPFIEELRTATTRRFEARETRQDREYAEALVGQSLGQGTALAAEDELDITQELLDATTPADVQWFFWDLVRTPPLVFVTGPAAGPLPAEADLVSLVDNRRGVLVPPGETIGDGPDSLMNRPPAAAVTDRESIGVLDATVVTYDNGARLAVRPTTISEDLVQFQAWSRGGFFVEEGAAVPLLGRSSNIILASGFERADNLTLARVLRGADVSLSGSVGRASESLSGEAATGDLETLLQLVHLQMTEPTIDELQVRRFVDRWSPLATDPTVSPEYAADLELWRMRYGTSPYYRLGPTIADLDGFDIDRELAAWTRRFDNAGDFLFIVVGDVDVDEAIELGASYLGTLPATDDRENTIDREPGVPEENLVATIAAGVGDQARLRINWESPIEFTPEAELTARTLESVVEGRLRSVIREELGASYSVTTAVTLLSEPKPWVDTIIELGTDPERIDEVAEVVRRELDTIRRGEIGDDEVETAVAQLLEDHRFFTNSEWMELVRFHLAHPDRPADEYLRWIATTEAITVADLAAMADVVFPPTRSVEVRLVPG